jgi:hypothetical protein
VNAVQPLPPPGAQRDAMYRDVLRRLLAAELPFLVGGTYAFSRLIGIAQPATKDLDLFVRREDCPRILQLLAAAGYRTETPYPHWLAKVHGADGDIDIIYSTGNGHLPVDDEWFANSLPGHVLGIAVQLAPMEETLCTKAFVMERERFDGADVIHLLRAGAETFDWPRLLRRFGSHWPVLLSHLILFGYVYPDERRRLPRGLVASLSARLEAGDDAPPAGICRGGLLSRAQYLVAFEEWGYDDARLQPHGLMSAEELRIWTEAAPRPLPIPAARDGDR